VDVDTTIERAVAVGAKLISPSEDKFCGDRNGTVEDPFGHRWFVSTHVKDISPEEIAELTKNFGKE
jgi:PhnB protein